jgi:hypothetical protein
MAPGVNIYSTVDSRRPNDYLYSDGTSMATPHIAGLAALLWGANPSESAFQIRNRILTNNDGKSALFNQSVSFGRSNANLAINDTDPDVINVYRFWSKQNGAHFYTTSEIERDSVVLKFTDFQFKFEGVGQKTYSTQKGSSTGVYRFYSKKNKAHFYTSSANERDKVMAEFSDFEWRYEGVFGYAYTTAQPNSSPIYRFYSKKNGAHFYTTAISERNSIINNFTDFEWKYEGEDWHQPV